MGEGSSIPVLFSFLEMIHTFKCYHKSCTRPIVVVSENLHKFYPEKNTLPPSKLCTLQMFWYTLQLCIQFHSSQEIIRSISSRRSSKYKNFDAVSQLILLNFVLDELWDCFDVIVKIKLCSRFASPPMSAAYQKIPRYAFGNISSIFIFSFKT